MAWSLRLLPRESGISFITIKSHIFGISLMYKHIILPEKNMYSTDPFPAFPDNGLTFHCLCYAIQTINYVFIFLNRATTHLCVWLGFAQHQRVSLYILLSLGWSAQHDSTTHTGYQGGPAGAGARLTQCCHTPPAQKSNWACTAAKAEVLQGLSIINTLVRYSKGRLQLKQIFGKHNFGLQIWIAFSSSTISLDLSFKR